MENLTLKEKLRCCELKICHSQCPIKWDNPYCHDTKCRECNVTWLKFEDYDANVRMCCGYHVCKDCQIKNNLTKYMYGHCPKCGM